jgi:hypothetical protein
MFVYALGDSALVKGHRVENTAWAKVGIRVYTVNRRVGEIRYNPL